MSIVGGIYGDGGYAKTFGGFHDTNGDFTTVGNEEFFEEWHCVFLGLYEVKSERWGTRIGWILEGDDLDFGTG